jgi:cell division protein FtsW
MVERHSKTLIIFLTVIALLITIGFVFIYSSSSIFALEKLGIPHYFALKQLAGFIIGIGGLIVCRLTPLSFIKKSSPYFFIGALILTAMTFIPHIGVMIHGSRRWISLAGFAFQPSELLKMALILYLAYILDKKHYSLNSFTHGYLPFLLILGIAAAIFLKQPDFGQMVTICIMALLLFFIAQVNQKHLLATIVPLIPVTALLIYLKPYRFRRILIFLNPWQDPQGAGFQIIQSLIAIGSGGITGVGIANSKQKFFYLPMQHTDFIFSIIAEETGFIGALMLIGLYIVFLYTGLKLAGRLRDPFSSYVVLGFVLLTSIQALINMCVATSLLPTKGIGLPFVSYGNSALVCGLAMVGVIINCVVSEREQYYHNARH